jgi:hypothetical protein
MSFFVVLVPVGKENIAAVSGDFSANRRADFRRVFRRLSLMQFRLAAV